MDMVQTVLSQAAGWPGLSLAESLRREWLSQLTCMSRRLTARTSIHVNERLIRVLRGCWLAAGPTATDVT